MSFTKSLALGGAMMLVAFPATWSEAMAQSGRAADSKKVSATRAAPQNLSRNVTVARTPSVRNAGEDAPAAAGRVATNPAAATPVAEPAETGPAALLTAAGQAAADTAAALAATVGAAAQAVTEAVAETVSTVTQAVSDAAGSLVQSAGALLQPAAPAGVTLVQQTTLAAPALPSPTVSNTLPTAPTGDPTDDQRTATGQAIAPEAVAPAVEKVFTVADRTQLYAALAEAQALAGAEIRLQPGNYGELRWTYKSYPLGRVFLKAATSTAPVFTSINLSNSSGMALVGLKVVSSVSPAVQLSSTSDLIFAGNFVQGATATLTDPWDDGNTGIHIRNASRTTVSHNRFDNLKSAAYIQRSAAVTFEHNTVFNVREGVNVAAASDLDLTRNLFHSFQPNFPKGEHPDAIQFWTSGETQGSRNVRITENAILTGGCKSVQGIFIRSETEGKTTVAQIRHSNFTIRRNVYYGSARNGLSVSSVDGATVENNIVVASPYGLSGIARASVTDPRCSGALVPGILSRNGTTTHRFRGNVTHVIGSTDGTRVDDIALGTGEGEFALTAVLAKQPTADVPTVAQFVTLDPSSVRTRGIGLLATFSGGKTLDGDAAVSRALSVHKGPIVN